MPPDEQLAGGRYTLGSVIGAGGQGTTFDALDTREGRAVAIKRFDVRGARAWKDVELAEREARVLSTLDHPLVPRYLDHFEEGGALYLVMEKVEGETLDSIRRREGALPEAEVRRFLSDADRALTYLHGRGSPIVHRDINPRNVVRRKDGAYVLIDFGAVSEQIRRREGASTLVGTMGYMAPEQLQGRAMPSTDVYAVGATALAALTGAEPETLPHIGLRFDVRSAVADRAGDDLVRSLEQMLEPDPEARAASLAAALDRFPSTAARRPAAASVAMEAAPRGPAPWSPEAAASEDAVVKSIRKLLWVLWGLGWITVPVTTKYIHAVSEVVPLVMFSALAGILVLTWHKGALLRMLLREVQGQRAAAPLRSTGTAPRPRVALGAAPRVRVRTTDTADVNPEGATQTESLESKQEARRR